MDLLIKILFFVIAVFYTNISEAKVFVLDAAVSEIKFAESVVEYKNESVEILVKNFEISCKTWK